MEQSRWSCHRQAPTCGLGGPVQVLDDNLVPVWLDEAQFGCVRHEQDFPKILWEILNDETWLRPAFHAPTPMSGTW